MVKYEMGREGGPAMSQEAKPFDRSLKKWLQGPHNDPRVLPPEPAFSGTPLSGEEPLSVQFTNESLGQQSQWVWEFTGSIDDPPGMFEENPLVIFELPGLYAVKLTVRGPGGDGVLVKEGYVAAGTAPTADFTGTPLSGAAPLDVQFTNASTGDITSHLWDFGDGTTSIETSPLHTYADPGTYTVKLTETGPLGVDTKTRTGYVTAS